MRFRIAFSTAVILLSGCAEKVQFRSVPAGAKVYVSDNYVGDTPTIYATRDVVDRPYRVEKEGFKEEGILRARLAGGRVVGAIFTLGIVAAARPLHYYIPNPVDVTLGPGTAPSPRAIAKLYDLKTSEIAEGSCNERGVCTVTFSSGRVCSGDSVRENQGVARSAQGSATVGGSVGGWNYGSALGGGYGGGWGGSYGGKSEGAATGREVATSQHGVAMLQCPDLLIDCSLTLDAFGPTGHGDCTDPKGGKYRLMLLPP